MVTNRHRSLAERGGRKALIRNKGLAHTQKRGKKMSSEIHESKKKGFEHTKLPAKLSDYLLRSNKSNINQSS